MAARSTASLRSLLATLAAAAAIVLFGGCDLAIDEPAPRPVTSTTGKPAPEIPVVNLPRSLREWNWGGGSCVHASTVMVLRWQNAMELAAYWRKTYAGGESYNGLTSKLNRNKVPFYATAGGGGQDVAGSQRSEVGGQKSEGVAFARWLETHGHHWYGTFAGDVEVLERCTADRRGGTIFYYPNHSIMFVGFTPDGQNAIVLDNNRIDKFIEIPKPEFIRKWRGYGGVCVVPIIGTPRPPIPWIAKR